MNKQNNKNTNNKQTTKSKTINTPHTQTKSKQKQ